MLFYWQTHSSHRFVQSSPTLHRAVLVIPRASGPVIAHWHASALILIMPFHLVMNLRETLSPWLDI